MIQLVSTKKAKPNKIERVLNLCFLMRVAYLSFVFLPIVQNRRDDDIDKMKSEISNMKDQISKLVEWIISIQETNHKMTLINQENHRQVPFIVKEIGKNKSLLFMNVSNLIKYCKYNKVLRKEYFVCISRKIRQGKCDNAVIDDTNVKTDGNYICGKYDDTTENDSFIKCICRT